MKANNVAVAAVNDIKEPKDEATTSTELTSEPPAKKLKESEPLEILSDKLPKESLTPVEKSPNTQAGKQNSQILHRTHSGWRYCSVHDSFRMQLFSVYQPYKIKTALIESNIEYLIFNCIISLSENVETKIQETGCSTGLVPIIATSVTPIEADEHAPGKNNLITSYMVHIDLCIPFLLTKQYVCYFSPNTNDERICRKCN